MKFVFAVCAAIVCIDVGVNWHLSCLFLVTNPNLCPVEKIAELQSQEGGGGGFVLGM